MWRVKRDERKQSFASRSPRVPPGRRGGDRRLGPDARHRLDRPRTKTRQPKVVLPTRKLGKTGVDVTILTVGTGAWRSLGGASDRLLRLAYAKGIRYLDTANAYGTEPAIAKFFKAVPEAKKDTFIVTKDTPRSPKQMIEQLDKRLASLELDSVDAFFFHGLGDHHTTDECIEFLKGQEFRETADAIRKSGKAKFIGFSFHHPRLAEMITTAAGANVVDMIMVKYNAFAAKDHPFNKALDAAHAKGIGLISMKQLAGSETMLKDMATKVPSLKDKGLAPYQMLLHAIWTDERISSCCVSMKNVDQMNEDVHAAQTFQPLKAAELREIHEFFLASKPTMCALCDGRCSEAAGTDAALGELTRYLDLPRASRRAGRGPQALCRLARVGPRLEGRRPRRRAGGLPQPPRLRRSPASRRTLPGLSGDGQRPDHDPASGPGPRGTGAPPRSRVALPWSSAMRRTNIATRAICNKPEVQVKENSNSR